MNVKNEAAGGGIGFFGLLTIVFIALKLTGYISWSWCWVLVFVWAPISIVAICFIFALGFVLMKEVFSNMKNNETPMDSIISTLIAVWVLVMIVGVVEVIKW